MTNKPPDLRVKRSLKRLQDALIDLMQEQPFAEIQISQIASRARVSRPTFYSHFQSKEDLLLFLLDGVFEEFFAELLRDLTKSEYSKLALCIQLFYCWKRHETMLLLVVSADLQQIMVSRLRDYLHKMLAFLQTQTGKPQARGDAFELMVSFMANGTYALLTQWATGRLPYTPEQMGMFLHQLTLSHEDVVMQI